MSFDNRTTLASPSGATLNLLVRRADGDARGVVQVNHGLAEHAARYAPFADFLAARGFHAYAHDHRGHGHTRAPDAPPGRFGGKDGGAKVIIDVAAVHDRIAESRNRWREALSRDVDAAVAAGDLPPGTDTAQVVYGLESLAGGAAG